MFRVSRDMKEESGIIPRVDGMVPDIFWKVVEWFRKDPEYFGKVPEFSGLRKNQRRVKTLVGPHVPVGTWAH